MNSDATVAAHTHPALISRRLIADGRAGTDHVKARNCRWLVVVAEMTVGCGEPFGVESKDARNSACLPNRNDDHAAIVVEDPYNTALFWRHTTGAGFAEAPRNGLLAQKGIVR